MLRKINLKTRLGLFLGSLTILLGVIGTINVLSDNHISEHIRGAEEYHYPLAINSMNLELWVERNLAIINAAALAGRMDLLTPLEDSEPSLQECFKNLSALIPLMPELAGKQKDLERHYAEAKKIGLQWVDATLAENWELEPKLSYKFAMLRKELGQLMTALKDTGVAGFTESLNQISNDMHHAWTITLTVFAIGFIGFIILNLQLYRSIAMPLQGLLQVVTMVRKGPAQLSQRIDVDSSDEIGQLGTAFNAMLNDLEISQSRLKQQTVGLERLVNERTTELEQEKDALRESERYRKAIWDSTPSGIVIINIQNNCIVDVNPFALKLMGRNKKDVVGRVCHRFICPAEKNKCPITDLGQTVDGSERRLVTTDRGEIPILKTAVPFNAQGKDLLIESFIDMASLKEAQEKLKAALASAESANQAKSAFLANMSHELRTPLNHIMGFTGLVLDKNFGDLTEIQEEYLGDVLTSSQHLLSLINDVLDLSKVEAGKMQLHLSEVNVPQLLQNSLVMIKEKILKRGLHLSTKIGEIPEIIQADERKVKQVIYNLLSNAVKFTPDGGKIRLIADLVPAVPQVFGTNGKKAPETSSGGKKVPAMMRISVTDTGLGIEPKDLELIFLPFEQAGTHITQKYQGTGLGLSLTQELVKLHGGMIWAKSEGHGQGATFTFTLPVNGKMLEFGGESDFCTPTNCPPTEFL